MAQRAGVVHRHPAGAGTGVGLDAGKRLVNRGHLEGTSVCGKNFVAVGTGHKHLFNAQAGKTPGDGPEPLQEIVLPAQIVGGFVAAVQDHAQVRYVLPQGLEKPPGDLRSGPGQGAPREEDLPASPGGVPGEECRVAPPLVGGDGRVAGEVRLAAVHGVAAHGQKQGCGGQFLGTDRPAQTAQAARIGIGPVLSGQGGQCDLSRRSVSGQKSALPDAGFALRAALADVAGLAGQCRCG